MRVELVYMQCNISDSRTFRTLHPCSDLCPYFSRMASLYALYVLWDCRPGFVLTLFKNVLPKARLLFLYNCSYKKECITSTSIPTYESTNLKNSTLQAHHIINQAGLLILYTWGFNSIDTLSYFWIYNKNLLGNHENVQRKVIFLIRFGTMCG